MRGFFEKHFPNLAQCDGLDLLMAPLASIMLASVIAGAIAPHVTPGWDQDCRPCGDLGSMETLAREEYQACREIPGCDSARAYDMYASIGDDRRAGDREFEQKVRAIEAREAR